MISDADALTRLINEAFLAERPFVEGDRVDHAGVLKYLATGKFLLLERNQSLIGCVYLERRGDHMYLGLLSVASSEQGKGWGRKLMDAAERYAAKEGCVAIDLRVISERADIRPFYERLGYAAVAVEAVATAIPVKVPFHFVVMSKPIGRAQGAQ
ncbi:MAG: GNAT family N-acetyltransferase [Acidobacteria bacterium]|nr:GNAT family N-acetyltransferase [Acidobacteriota bacterium]MBS1864780.1 GNAT family N-acetyltransferase [Acidobacteriota bacterium]